MSDDYRTEEQREGAIKAIKKFANNESLVIGFDEMALNPYVNGARIMEIYSDDNGQEYWVDPINNRLIQSAPCAGLPPKSYDVSPENRLAVAELRPIAHDIMSKQGVNVFNGYQKLEDNRNRQVYFFRFDDSETKVSESELPPFIQVALRANGKLISYTNTLSQESANSEPTMKPIEKTLSNKIMDIVNSDEPNGDKQAMAEALELQYKKA